MRSLRFLTYTYYFLSYHSFCLQIVFYKWYNYHFPFVSFLIYTFPSGIFFCIHILIKLPFRYAKYPLQYISSIHSLPLMFMTNRSLSYQVLESCPDVDSLRVDMESMKERLGRFSELEEAMKGINSKSNEKYESFAFIALELGVRLKKFNSFEQSLGMILENILFIDDVMHTFSLGIYQLTAEGSSTTTAIQRSKKE